MFTRQRKEVRTVIAVHAHMRFAGRDEPVMLANASSRGVLALLDAPPARGTRVQLDIGGSPVGGRVRWCGATRCGVALDAAIDVADLFEGKAMPISFVPATQGGFGPSGIFGAIVGDGPTGVRVGQAVLLFLAVASAAFAISRLGSPVLAAHAAPSGVAIASR